MLGMVVAKSLILTKLKSSEATDIFKILPSGAMTTVTEIGEV